MPDIGVWIDMKKETEQTQERLGELLRFYSDEAALVDHTANAAGPALKQRINCRLPWRIQWFGRTRRERSGIETLRWARAHHESERWIWGQGNEGC